MLEIRKEDGLFTIKFFEKDISSDLLRELLRNFKIDHFSEKHVSSIRKTAKISKNKSRKYHRSTIHLLEIAKQSTTSSNGQRWTRGELYE